MGLRKNSYQQTNGGDEIPADVFQILKDDAVKSAAPNLPANLEKTAVAIGLEKVSFHFNPKERQCQRIFIFYSKNLNVLT